MILFLTATVRTEKQTQSFRSNKFNKMCVKLIRDPFFPQLNEPKSYVFSFVDAVYCIFAEDFTDKRSKGFLQTFQRTWQRSVALE